MIQSVLTFILKLLLGGLFQSLKNTEAEAARRKADAATIYANTAQEVGDVQVAILKKQQEVEQAYKGAALPPEDPFGFSRFNSSK